MKLKTELLLILSPLLCVVLSQEKDQTSAVELVTKINYPAFDLQAGAGPYAVQPSGQGYYQGSGILGKTRDIGRHFLEHLQFKLFGLRRLRDRIGQTILSK